MKATASWKEGMVFTGIGDSGFPILMDADSSAGGQETGVRPIELIALGLIGCQAMDVLSILRKKQQSVTDFDVKFNGPRSVEHPRVFTSAVITFIVTGKHIEERALVRAIELSATKYCPAQAMLEQAFPMDLHYEIYEDEGGGDKRLVYQGAWQKMVND